ncbi:hypothetical protein CR513_58600, partial [Mucuna pruriens]
MKLYMRHGVGHLCVGLNSVKSLVDKKSYHDKRMKALEFQEGNHMFLRVTPKTAVGRALKSCKLTSCFIGPYQISKRVGKVAYKISLPHLFQIFIIKYIHDPSHVIKLDNIQAKKKLTYEVLPLKVEDRRIKKIIRKEILLVK